MSVSVEFTEKEIKTLKRLVKDLDSFYTEDSVWSFEDVDVQREIAVEFACILRDKIHKKATVTKS
jgi:N-acetyl-anhydromuramyl-L-alanine amidase AmpD